jgi:hypothetical protein
MPQSLPMEFSIIKEKFQTFKYRTSSSYSLGRRDCLSCLFNRLCDHACFVIGAKFGLEGFRGVRSVKSHMTIFYTFTRSTVYCAIACTRVCVKQSLFGRAVK